MEMEPETLQQITEALFLVVVALFALRHAANQVNRMTEANKAATLQAHAALLLELDLRWNETAMVEAQHKTGNLIREVDAKAEARWKHLPLNDIKVRAHEIYAEEMKVLSDEGGLPYKQYMRLVEFLETLGYIARKGYLPKVDIINLFGGTILSCRRVFDGHIKQIQAKPGTTGRVWEHFIIVFSFLNKFCFCFKILNFKNTCE